MCRFRLASFQVAYSNLRYRAAAFISRHQHPLLANYVGRWCGLDFA